MKTDKVVSFFTTITNFGKIKVVLLKPSKATVMLG
jgi:hypothetical protein